MYFVNFAQNYVDSLIRIYLHAGENILKINKKNEAHRHICQWNR